MRHLLREGVRGAAMLAGVVSRLRHPLTPAEARAALDARREHRASAFLMLLRRAVYQAPGSPYAPLLRAARCEYDDIERMVRTDGVEGTLAALFQSGVFLTVNELKGLVPVTRAGAPYWVGRERLRNPCWVVRDPEDNRARLLHEAMFRDHEVAHTLVMAAVGGCAGATPTGGSWGTRPRLPCSAMRAAGWTPVDWFTHLDPREPGIDLDDRWSPLALRLAGTLAGRPMPPARYVPLDAPDPILAWIRGHLDAGRTPHLCGSTSLMVRLAVLAWERGLDLTGARFTVRRRAGHGSPSRDDPADRRGGLSQLRDPRGTGDRAGVPAPGGLRRGAPPRRSSRVGRWPVPAIPAAFQRTRSSSPRSGRALPSSS